MELSAVQEILSKYGYEYTKEDKSIKVKLGGFATKLKIELSVVGNGVKYSYHQALMSYLSLFWLFATYINVKDGDIADAVLTSILGLMTMLLVILTEIKVSELRRYINQNLLT